MKDDIDRTNSDKNMTIEDYKSIPTRLDQLTENISDEYSLYKVDISSTVIDSYFPEKLQAFTQKTWKSLVKRYFFYSKPVVIAIRSQISDNMQQLSDSTSLDDLLKELLSVNDSTIRYNFVITDDCLVFIRIPSHRYMLHYALGKHISLADRAKNVRFAGEMWCDENNCFQLNNSSGTYRSSDELIEQAVEFFNYLTPELQFQGTSFRISAQPSLKRRVKEKIKQELNINPDEHFIQSLFFY